MSEAPMPATPETPPLGSAAKQGAGKPLEGRVSSLEVHMDHMASTVTTLGKSMNAGFAETRRMFEESEQRANARDSKLHARITDHQAAVLQKGQWSWPTIVITVGLLITISGVFAKFIDLRLSADEVLITDAVDDLAEFDERQRADAERLAIENRNMMVNQARMDERLRQLEGREPADIEH